MALYSTGLCVLNNISKTAKILEAGGSVPEALNKYKAISAITGEISSGTASGTAYGSSFLITDLTDRFTNNIDNKEDVFSIEAGKETR